MPLTDLLQPGLDIRLFVGRAVLAPDPSWRLLGTRQRRKDSLCPVRNILGIIAAFKDEDNLPLAKFDGQLDESFGKQEKSCR